MTIDKRVPMHVIEDIVDKLFIEKNKVVRTHAGINDDIQYSPKALRSAKAQAFNEAAVIVQQAIEFYMNSEDSKLDQCVLTQQEREALGISNKKGSCI